MLLPAKLAATLMIGVLATAATGCGESRQEAQQARERAAEQQRLREKAAGLEEEIKVLRAQQLPATTSPDTATPRPGPSRNCGAGVGADPDTSCAFALNTAQEWVDTSAGQTIQVFNPDAKRSYTMKCSNGPRETTCRGGRGAVVYIR